MRHSLYLYASLLLALAGPALAGDLTHFEAITHNKIGEEVVEITVQEHGREYLHLALPATQVDLTEWKHAGHLHLDWSRCRTAEMLASVGELTQCIRRAELSLHGEPDALAPATLDLTLAADGLLRGSYTPDEAVGAKPLYFTARAQLPALTWTSWRQEPVALALPRHEALPPVARATDGATHFIFFGDAGTGDQNQYAVADGLAQYCSTHKGACSFALMLGDNFYETGVNSSKDDQWNSKFEKPYSRLGIDFYPVLGNHDHLGDIQAQLDYSAQSEHWKMPARYYSFVAGDVAFFGIDSDDFDADQAQWLRSSLASSNKPWKIVYGHHPVYSYGQHGDTDYLKTDLLPVLQAAGVDFYICGHDHDQQVIEKSGVNFFLVGSGGAGVRDVSQGDGTIFAESEYGFAQLTIGGNTAHLTIMDATGQQAFARDYAKPAPGGAATPVKSGP